MSKVRVPPLNMTLAERRTLVHCILAGKDDAVDHFGEEEAERIQSLWEKLGMESNVQFNTTDKSQ